MESYAVAFRNYGPDDLSSCANLALEAWPSDPEIALGLRTDEMISIWIGATVASSNWAEVAEDEHGVVGLLLGKVKGGPALKMQHSSLGIELRMFMRGLSGSGGKILRSFRLIVSFLTTELKLLVNSPKADAEILILVVSEAHRGKGLGKKLVERFVDNAKKQGAETMSVYTEDQSSNWRFYESYGFKQVAKFYDNGTSRYSGKHSTALIYRLDI